MMNDADIRFETESEREQRYEDLMQAIADLLGEKGYELNSHEETAVMLAEVSAAYLPAEPTDSMTADTDPVLDPYRDEVALIREAVAALGPVTVAVLPGSPIAEIVRRMEAMDDPEPNDLSTGEHSG